MANVLPSLSMVTFSDEPLNNDTPLKSFVATLLTYEANCEYSWLYRDRSASDLVTSCAWMASSLIWFSASPILPKKPFCVWLNELALVMLLLAACTRLIWAFKRRATALPAGSSDGLVILEPEDNSDNAFC